MTLATLDAVDEAVVAAVEVEEPSPAVVPPGRLVNDAPAPRMATAAPDHPGEQVTASAPDPIAEFVPWIPIVVPLFGALMMCNAWAVELAQEPDGKRRNGQALRRQVIAAAAQT